MAIAAAMLVLTLSLPAAAVVREQTSGKVSYLRVHDVGTGYGPLSDEIDVEVVVKLSNQPDNAFGFQLRRNNNRVAAQGMLDLLRDAFNYDHQVTIDYWIDPGKKNGKIMRVWLTR